MKNKSPAKPDRFLQAAVGLGVCSGKQAGKQAVFLNLSGFYPRLAGRPNQGRILRTDL